MALSQAVAPFLDIIVRNVDFAVFNHVELLLLREVLWERDRDKTGDTQFMDCIIERYAHL